MGQISGQSVPVLRMFARKKEEKESQEGEEERQNQEEQESILAKVLQHTSVTVISAFLGAVASVENGRLPKKSGGIVQKTSFEDISSILECHPM